MEIKVADKYWLKSDRFCCWISEIKTVAKGETKGEEYENIIGYYRNPQDAFTALLGHKIRAADVTDLNELKVAIRGHTDFIEGWLKDVDIREKVK